MDLEQECLAIALHQARRNSTWDRDRAEAISTAGYAVALALRAYRRGRVDDPRKIVRATVVRELARYWKRTRRWEAAVGSESSRDPWPRVEAAIDVAEGLSKAKPAHRALAEAVMAGVAGARRGSRWRTARTHLARLLEGCR